MNFRLLGLFMVLIFGLTGCASKAEQAFMQGCTSDGYLDNEEQCSCVYENLEDHYGEDVLESMGEKNYLPDDFPQRMIESMAMCGLEG